MRVHGDVKPPEVAAGSMPNKPGRAWVRLTLNAKQETDKDGHNSWVYDEYITEVEDTPGLLDEVTANYDKLLREAKANEKSKADPWQKMKNWRRRTQRSSSRWLR